MNKFLFNSISAACLATASLSAESNFQLNIDGKVFEVSPGQEQKLTLPDGTTHTITLKQKEYHTFSSDFFSFQHKNSFSPSKADLGSGINQTMMVSPLGTGVLIQEYKTIDPTMLIDLMIQELTKEEVSAGYELKVIDRERKLKDGTVLKGKVAITSLDGEKWEKEVYAQGSNGKGVLVVTFIEENNKKTDSDILKTFWDSLQTRP